MKKLMVMLCAGAIAAFAHGAAMTWGSGTISLPGGGSAGAGDVTAYLFVIDSTAYATYAAKTTGTALNEALWSAYGTKLTTADASKASVKKGNKADLADPNTYFTAGNSKDAYAAILYVTKDEDYYMGNIGHYTFEADVDVSYSGMASILGGSEAGGSTATAWTAVPEPTSGLLLLLGMAGLALKRKRA